MCIEKQFCIEAGTRIAAVDANNRKFSSATIITLQQETEVHSKRSLQGLIGYGDPDVYLMDGESIVNLGSEPREITEISYHPERMEQIEDMKEKWNVDRIVLFN